MVKRIVWDQQAKAQLKEAIAYIRKESPQNAEKVKNEILQAITALMQNPGMYPPDKLKLNNKNQFYRAFELHKFRVSYYVYNNKVLIIRVRHTKRDPLFF